MCEVPVLGEDGSDYTDGYMTSGDIPSFKIYNVSEGIYIDATASEDVPWENNIHPILDLLSGFTPRHFNVELEETGESTLFIFNIDADDNLITNLEIGDEVGLFDATGIIDDSGTIGEILVAAGVWTGAQLEVTAIGSVDLSAFDGPILPGYISGHTMTLKIWDQSEQSECDATYTISFGSGSFNGLFTNINSITLECD
jgi:hypothetical protein